MKTTTNTVCPIITELDSALAALEVAREDTSDASHAAWERYQDRGGDPMTDRVIAACAAYEAAKVRLAAARAAYRARYAHLILPPIR